MKRFTALQKIGEKNGYTVGIFTTNGTNFYSDSVLYISVGNPINRNSHRIQTVYDVSYSINTNQGGKSKFAQAIRQAHRYIINNITPDVEQLDTAESNRRIKNRRTMAKKRYIESRDICKKFKIEQMQITNARNLSVKTAIAENLIDPRYADHIGINEQEKIELQTDDNFLREYNSKIFIYEAQIGEPAQWRLLQPQPHMNTGCALYK